MTDTCKADILKSILCFVIGMIVLIGCAIAYWVFSHDPRTAPMDYAPIIGLIAVFVGGGLMAVGVKILTGFKLSDWD